MKLRDFGEKIYECVITEGNFRESGKLRKCC